MQRVVIEHVQHTDQLPSTAFLDHISDLAFLFSRDAFELRYINPKAADLLGWSLPELLLLDPWFNFLLDAESWQKLSGFVESLTSDGPRHGERSPLQICAQNSAGTALPLQLHSFFACDDSLLVLATPLLSTESAEQILRQSQARFRSIIDSLSICLVLKDRHGRRLYANRAYLELRGYSLPDIIGKQDRDLFPEDIAAGFAADDERVMATGEVIHKFEENVAHDGSRTWTEIIKGPLRDADNNISGVQILFWDATNRKHTEMALEQERYLLHTLLDNVPDSIYFKDRESRFMRISRGMAEKFHLSSPDVAIGKTDADIFTHEHAQQARDDEVEIMQTGKPMIAHVERETWHDAPDTWCSTTKLPLYDSSGAIIGTFGISRDITELIKAEQQLREARDVADRANKAKSIFLANMSHEIRTPMNGIIGMTELLSHTPLEDAQRSFVEMIEQSAQALLRIINDILDFSKIEAGKLELEKRSFDLKRCVSHAAKSLAVRAAQKSLELILSMEPDLPDRLIGDPDRLRQILVNLAGNATKFTSSGEITIRVAVADGPPASPEYTLHFSVTDTGIGIPLEKQASIFEAFAQVDASTTRQFGGTGLGLSISSQLVEMMGGRIWLDSEPGVGSTFHFTAKFAPAKAPKADEGHQLATLKGTRVLIIDDNAASRESLQVALERRGMKVETAADQQQAFAKYRELATCREQPCAVLVDHSMPEGDGLELISRLRADQPDFRPTLILLTSLARPIQEEFLHDYQIAAILQKPALQSEICFALRRAMVGEPLPKQVATAAASQPPVPGLRFLLAEDGVVNQAVFVGLLEREGHQVTAVDDGIAAVEAWTDFDFDAILMDVQMPRMDGLEATALIRQKEKEQGSGRHIPIIAVTAAAMEEDMHRCLEAGMDGYLSKPIDVKEFQRVVQQIRTGEFPLGVERPASETQSAPATNPKKQSSESVSGEVNFDAPLCKLRATADQQRALVSTLQLESQQRLDELTRAINVNDTKLLIRAAHSLRSAAALFEAHKVVAAASEVERLARAGDFAAAAAQFSELREQTVSLLNASDQWLASHG